MNPHFGDFLLVSMERRFTLPTIKKLVIINPRLKLVDWDLLASNPDVIREFYPHFNDWIPDRDRPEIGKFLHKIGLGKRHCVSRFS